MSDARGGGGEGDLAGHHSAKAVYQKPEQKSLLYLLPNGYYSSSSTTVLGSYIHHDPIKILITFQKDTKT